MKTKTLYIAFDDTEYDTAEACKAYEAAHVEARLVGLTIEQVRAALAREDTDLADAIEELGTRINKARRAAGDLRRGKSPPADGGRATEIDGTKPEGEDKMAEALRRTRDAGRVAAAEGKSGTVPAAFVGKGPLADAWLDGWREGQPDAEPAPESEAD